MWIDQIIDTLSMKGDSLIIVKKKISLMLLENLPFFYNTKFFNFLRFFYE